MWISPDISNLYNELPLSSAERTGRPGEQTARDELKTQGFRASPRIKAVSLWWYQARSGFDSPARNMPITKGYRAMCDVCGELTEFYVWDSKEAFKERLRDVGWVAGRKTTKCPAHAPKYKDPAGYFNRWCEGIANNSGGRVSAEMVAASNPGQKMRKRLGL